jgi:hypothetical protein
MTWQAFVGDWNDGDSHLRDWEHMNYAGLSWDEARQELIAVLEKFDDDYCPRCRLDAGEAVDELLTLAPDTPWDGNVDGDSYVLAEDAP